MSRVLIVSNRLPDLRGARRQRASCSVNRSAGGLATGLCGVHARSGGLWIGWPGISGPLHAEEEAAL